MATNTQSTTKTALQLVGSTDSPFFFDLSVLYAKEVVRPPGFDLQFVIAYPDGSWSVSPTLSTTADRITLSQMIEEVKGADLLVPHLFCQAGLTSLRTFFEDVLHIPVVGSPGKVLDIAQDKHLTKLIAEDAGVPIPKGVKVSSMSEALLAMAEIGLPLIIKPNRTDNSDGLSLVTEQSDFEAAMQRAFDYSDNVLIEDYIPGRELRGAVLEVEGTYQVLPFIEYGVSEERPIRQREDKYKFDNKGSLLAQSDKILVPATCPATVSQATKEALSDAMISLHQGLGCRDFSMYDFRVHAETGSIYLLEAGLFWSFSEASMISSMLRAEGSDLMEITKKLWLQVAKRKNKKQQL